jgi:heptosyltransferase I
VPRFEAQRICVVRTSAMGDVVHALAMVNGLRLGYPNAEVAWILHPTPHDVVREQPTVDRFIVFPRHGGWRTLRRQLAAERFDLCLVPQVSFKSAVVTALVRSPLKLGFDFARSRELHYFFTNRHLPRRQPRHVQEQYLEFLDYLDIHDYEVRWDIVVTPEEQEKRLEFLARLRRPLLGLVVASSSRAKDWTPAGYAALADAAEERFGLHSVLIGGPSALEAAVAREILSMTQCRPTVALDAPVRDTIWKLSACRVVVAPDTGPLHLAVALGVPTVGLYGLSDPRRCGPYRHFEELVVDHYNEPGEDPERPVTRRLRPGRMATITPEEVLQRVALAMERYPVEA